MVRSCWLALAATAPLVAACTVIEVDGRRSPAGLEANGLVDGHLAFGVSGETTPLRVQLFDGRSDGAWFELVVWKLFRFEIGLAGLDVGLGPVDAGLGILFFDPALPPQPPRKPAPPVQESGEPPAAEATSNH